ncbi:MAG: hypothetical protein ABIJ47_14710 [Candidatus Bathyarchaeota archaeon]
MTAKITVQCDADDCAKIDKGTRSFCTGGPDSKIYVRRSQCRGYVMDKAYLDAQLKERTSKRAAPIHDYTASIERVTTREELDAKLDGKRVKEDEVKYGNSDDPAA